MPDTTENPVSYASYPYPLANPAHVRGIAQLFGLEACAPDKARILELGCASGNNLLSIASLYPGSECVGVELAAADIDEAKKNAAALGVTNIDFRAMSALDIDAGFGKFDYIIAHGFYSWVPQAVREGMMTLLERQLSKNGVAYVSYNTLPGWNAAKSVREMMQFHTARLTDPKEKAAQARAILQFVYSVQPEGGSAWRELLAQELRSISERDDSYLLHEQLGEHNEPFYFHRFMETAVGHGMQYLGDANLPTMFAGNLPGNAAQMLQNIGDLIATEQYMDFITNRRYRTSLLCRREINLNRALEPKLLRGTYLRGLFSVEPHLHEMPLRLKAPVNLQIAQGRSIGTQDALTFATLLALAAHSAYPVTLETLAREVEEKLVAQNIVTAGQSAEILDKVAGVAVHALLSGAAEMRPHAPPYAATVSDAPEAAPLARHQAATQPWVANRRMEIVPVSSLDRGLLPLLDGRKQGARELAGRVSAEIDAVSGALRHYAQSALLVG